MRRYSWWIVLLLSSNVLTAIVILSMKSSVFSEWSEYTYCTVIDVITAPCQYQHNCLGPKRSANRLFFPGAYIIMYIYKKTCLRHQDNHPASLTLYTSKQLSNP